MAHIDVNCVLLSRHLLHHLGIDPSVGVLGTAHHIAAESRVVEWYWYTQAESPHTAPRINESSFFVPVGAAERLARYFGRGR